jgi:DNA repair protein RecO (recombination protein O)
MAELLTKCLKQPEVNEELFQFAEDCFLHLDQSNESVTANFPLFFALHLAVFFGFRIDDQYTEKRPFLDLQEGTFTSERPSHPHFLEDKQAVVTSQLLKVMQPKELEEIRLNHEFRRNLLYAYERFYAFHIQDFGPMKTLSVLKEILN